MNRARSIRRNGSKGGKRWHNVDDQGRMGRNRAGCSCEILLRWAVTMRHAKGAKIVSISEAVSAARDCDSKMPISETELRRILACWRPKTTAAATILPEPVNILEGPAAEGIHADILASPSLELQLKLGRKLNLQLNRKCRGAAPPRAVVIHFQGERRYAHTFSNHPVSNNDRESRPGGGGRRRPQSSSRAPAIPVKNFVRGTPKRTGSQCLHRSTSRPANARVLPGRVAMQY